MKTLIKTGLPVLCALLIPLLIVFAYFFLVEVLSGHARLPDFSFVQQMSISVLTITMLHFIFLGLPAVFFLNRLNRFSWRPLVLCGFAFGFVPISMMGLASIPEDASYSLTGVRIVTGDMSQFLSWWSFAQTSLKMGMVGAVCASVFWLVWRYADVKLSNG